MIKNISNLLLWGGALAGGGGGGGGGGGDTPSGGEDWIGDGNTHIWISLAEGRTSPMLGVCPNGTVTVDWGDGTTPDVLTGTSTSTVKWTPNHEYAKAGDYVITLTVDGEMGFGGSNSLNQGSYILRQSSTGDYRNYVYVNAVKKVELGNDVTSIGGSAFQYCYSLANIKIPASITSIGDYAFHTCHSLANIKIPDIVTSIGTRTFQYCYSLANIKISNSVTSIGSYAFAYCYGLAKIRFEGTTPPTVSSSNAFNDIPTDFVISVPVGSLEAYKTATNYPSASTYTYVEE